MTPNEALEILNEYGIDFELNDTSFGDGSIMISHNRVFDSSKDANQFIQALNTILNYIEGEI